MADSLQHSRQRAAADAVSGGEDEQQPEGDAGTHHNGQKGDGIPEPRGAGWPDRPHGPGEQVGEEEQEHQADQGIGRGYATSWLSPSR